MVVAPYSQVVALQRKPFLFQAYELVLSLLEDVFTPMFCHSDEVRPARPGSYSLMEGCVEGKTPPVKQPGLSAAGFPSSQLSISIPVSGTLNQIKPEDGTKVFKPCFSLIRADPDRPESGL